MAQATFVLFYEEQPITAALGLEAEAPEKMWGLAVGELEGGDWIIVDDGMVHHAVSRQQVIERWTGEWQRS